MKGRTKRAQKARTKVKRKATVQIVCYAGPVAKLLLVEAARKSNRSLSSFLVLSGLDEAVGIGHLQVFRAVMFTISSAGDGAFLPIGVLLALYPARELSPRVSVFAPPKSADSSSKFGESHTELSNRRAF